MTWVGTELTVHDEGVTVTIGKTLLAEVQRIVEEALLNNVISVKLLCKLAGKANFIAGIVWVWKPFISDLGCDRQVQEHAFQDSPHGVDKTSGLVAIMVARLSDPSL